VQVVDKVGVPDEILNPCYRRERKMAYRLT